MRAHLTLLAAGLIFDAVFGYPAWLYRRIGHPVTWLGALIATLERRCNRATLGPARRRALGVMALTLVLLAATLPAIGVEVLCHRLLPGIMGDLVLGVIASSLLAARSLHDHVRAVAEALARGGLAGGRAAVGAIVGRDPAALDEAGVLRAAIESLAENFSDAVIAPAFWGALFGLPGLALYKAANTADSMIGHRTARFADFGFAAARFDDLINLPAARLAALLLALAAPRRLPAALRAALHDARHHRSPNAGWPEAAMAGALGLRLAGPRVYEGIAVFDAWMGDGRAEANARDLARALALYRRAVALTLALVLVFAVIARG
ncbi:MAG: adenosylcobinamide-phosphate synthase CbiB [Acidibrevibacterium sp.]|uniref:adenosylcobinamide-phosphate synthase CbiB n=1 Tax=Acidibrevibacterium sp. TaxID=2606776 RepID=UPI003CFC5F1A